MIDALPRRPDFFLVGAAKSGTTSLAKHLGEHPDLFVTNPKEPNFFALPEGKRPECVGPADSERLFETLLKYSVTSRAEYGELFATARPEAVAGEASVRYLYEDATPARIATEAPEARILMILRDPVERLHSHYHMNLKLGLEPLDLHRALDAEDERVASGWGWDWHYRRVGRYGEQLARYLEHFPRDQVLVLFHQDFGRSPRSVYERACRFLGVDPARAEPDFSRRSLVGSTPRRRWLQRLLWEDSPLKAFARTVAPAGLRRRVTRRVNQANQTGVPKLNEQLRAEIGPAFTDDRRLLEELIGQEVPW